ncbi:hypothetical protein BDR04DRAFT_1120055 [Suillus decipiens]|nr:hypothetical protein BDR04DRAFT_1120055 [Suillus decipiens]
MWKLPKLVVISCTPHSYSSCCNPYVGCIRRTQKTHDHNTLFNSVKSPSFSVLHAFLPPIRGSSRDVCSVRGGVVSAASAVAAYWPVRSARVKQLEAEEDARKMETLANMAVLLAMSKASEAEDSAAMTQSRLEELKRQAAEAARRAEEARLVVERRWFEGVRPECRPSNEDITRMKVQYHYSPESIHIAVVGSAGAVAASTGIVEITYTVARYADPHKDSRMVWYDVPGSGTPNVPDWKYFNDMGLYIFDCIIVLTNDRVLDSDLAILRACKQFKNIEAFIVRSKSDQHICNMVCEKMPQGFDICDPDMNAETRFLFLKTKSEERQRFIDETSQNVQTHLERETPSE